MGKIISETWIRVIGLVATAPRLGRHSSNASHIEPGKYRELIRLVATAPRPGRHSSNASHIEPGKYRELIGLVATAPRPGRHSSNASHIEPGKYREFIGLVAVAPRPGRDSSGVANWLWRDRSNASCVGHGKCLRLLGLAAAMIALPFAAMAAKGTVVVENFERDRLYKWQNLTFTRAATGDAAHGTKAIQLKVTVTKGKPAIVWLDNVIPGKAAAASISIRGDGTALGIQLRFADRPALQGGGETWLYYPDMGDSDATLVDWTGWKRISIKVPIKGKATYDFNTSPTVGNTDFPVALNAIIIKHPIDVLEAGDTRLAGLPGTIKTTIGIGLIKVQTELAAAEQFWAEAALGRPGNLVRKGENSTVWISNRLAAAKVKAVIRVLDGAGREVLKLDKEISVPAGAIAPVSVGTGALPLGWYRLTCRLEHGGKTVFILQDPEVRPSDADAVLIKQLPRLQVQRASSFTVMTAADIPAPDKFWEVFSSKQRLKQTMLESAASLEFTWDDLERRQTRWLWMKKMYHGASNHSFDRVPLEKLINAIRESGLKPVGRLGFCAQWAARGMEESRITGEFKASKLGLPRDGRFFENYVYRVVKRYRGQIKTWEVWNEPDLSTDFGDRPDVFLNMLLKPAYEAAKRADPQCTVLIGGVTYDNLQRFLVGIIRAGGGKYFDGVSIHMLNDFQSPEEMGYARFLEGGRPFLKKQMGKDPIFWLSDITMPSGALDGRFTTGIQGAYLVRSMIISKVSGINRFLTLIRSQDDVEEGSGLVHKIRRPSAADPDQAPSEQTYSLKAGYLTVQQGRRILAGKPFNRAVPLQGLTPGKPRAYLFSGDKTAVFALWRLGDPLTMSIPVPKGGPGTVSIVDAYGNATAPAVKSGRFELELGHFPVYLRVAAAAAAETETVLLEASYRPGPDGDKGWRSNLIAAVILNQSDRRARYKHTVKGGKIETFTAPNISGDTVTAACAVFTGSESFTIPLPAMSAPSDIVLIRRILYMGDGETATISVNGVKIGRLGARPMARAAKGFKIWASEAVWIPAVVVQKDKSALTVTLTAVDGTSRSSAWFAYAKPAGTPLAMSDLDPLMYQRARGELYHNSTISGLPLGIGDTKYKKGLGTNADSRFLFVVAGQSRLTGKVGVDVLAEASTRVRTRIYTDGKVIWNISGIKKATRLVEFDVDTKGTSEIVLEVESEAADLSFDFIDWVDLELR